MNYDNMSPSEREDFENDAASEWLDRKRDRELEEQFEREAARNREVTEGDK